MSAIRTTRWYIEALRSLKKTGEKEKQEEKIATRIAILLYDNVKTKKNNYQL